MKEESDNDFAIFDRFALLPLHGVYVMYEVWRDGARAFKYQPRGSTEAWVKHLPQTWAVKILGRRPHIGGRLTGADNMSAGQLLND